LVMVNEMMIMMMMMMIESLDIMTCDISFIHSFIFVDITIHERHSRIAST